MFGTIRVIFIFFLVNIVSGRKVSIDLRSTGCFDGCVVRRSCRTISECCRSSIRIEGTEHTNGKNGISIVALDTYSGNVTGKQHISRLRKQTKESLTDFFTKLPPMAIVIVTSQRACAGSLGGWYQLIQKYLFGATDQFDPSVYDSVIAVTCKDKCPPFIARQKTIPSFRKRVISFIPLKLSFQLEVQDVKVVPSTTTTTTTTAVPLVTAFRQRNTTTVTPVSQDDRSNTGKRNKLKSGERGKGVVVLAVSIIVSSLFLIVVIIVIYLVRRRKAKASHISLYSEPRVNPPTCEERYASLHGNEDSPCYEILRQNDNIYQDVNSNSGNASCPLIGAGTAGSRGKGQYDSPPLPVPSTSPSKSFLALSSEGRIDNLDPNKFAQYVQVTKDGCIYKAPSNVPKHEPPMKPPQVLMDDELYVDMEEHLYDKATPCSSPYEPISFMIPTINS